MYRTSSSLQVVVTQGVFTELMNERISTRADVRELLSLESSQRGVIRTFFQHLLTTVYSFSI